ncbi:MAG: PAS domain S-box protein, partial [Candidatus Omnitrophica bacterium]|nr:PAS domain S-box protein [Candidatus Omnitrophota bacterium]
MGKPIRALLVEDSKVAALAVVRELERGGFDVTSKRVETKEEFINALSNEEWDVVISDYVLPGLNGAEALDLLHQKGKDLPFIMVSGTIIEDVAVEIMKRGVHDYVMKDNLAGLCPVVMREVKDARVRHEKKSSEEQLKWQLELMKTITDNAASCLFMMDVKGHPTFMNPAAEKVTGYTLDKIKDKPLHDSVHYKYPDGRPYPMSECPIDNAQAELTEMKNYEDVFTKEDGTLYSVVCYLAPLTLGGKVFGSVLEFRDITESKKEEANLRRLATVVLDSNDAITIQDLDGNITAWNRGAEKMYGWSEEEALK